MEHASWTATAVPDNVRELRREVGDFAAAHGLGEQRVDDVRLCVSEAVTNVVLHAYPDGPGTVTVEAHAADGSLMIQVTDTGIGFRERDDSPGSGYGMGLIASVASSVTLETPATGGTELHLRFDASP
jgi:anti-sigma regulatory factor (Ser/Thr protein kinase)